MALWAVSMDLAPPIMTSHIALAGGRARARRIPLVHDNMLVCCSCAGGFRISPRASWICMLQRENAVPAHQPRRYADARAYLSKGEAALLHADASVHAVLRNRGAPQH